MNLLAKHLYDLVTDVYAICGVLLITCAISAWRIFRIKPASWSEIDGLISHSLKLYFHTAIEIEVLRGIFPSRSKREDKTRKLVEAPVIASIAELRQQGVAYCDTKNGRSFDVIRSAYVNRGVFWVSDMLAPLVMVAMVGAVLAVTFGAPTVPPQPALAVQGNDYLGSFSRLLGSVGPADTGHPSGESESRNKQIVDAVGIGIFIVGAAACVAVGCAWWADRVSNTVKGVAAGAAPGSQGPGPTAEDDLKVLRVTFGLIQRTPD